MGSQSPGYDVLKILKDDGMVSASPARVGMEAAVAGLRHRLLEEQDRERKRYAKELRDINDRLLLSAARIEQLKNDISDQNPDLHAGMDTIREQTLEISHEVQALSHELHPSTLDYLGLVAAMRSFCREFGEQEGLKIEFGSHDVPRAVAPDASLCLFRILQEGLRNAASQSGSRQFDVQLWEATDEIHLTVSDSGIGFDSEAARQGFGLGLINMQARVQLMKGTLSVELRSRLGTTIHARMPLS
jgi:signal transduction histidine kinase